MKKSVLRIFAVSTAFFLIAGAGIAQGTCDQTQDKVRLQDQSLIHDRTLDQATDKDQDKTQLKDQDRLKDQVQLKSKSETVTTSVKEQNRSQFRNSLTKGQIAILENAEMTRNQKRKAFMGSLTDQQRLMLRESQMTRQRQCNEMCDGSMTQEQTKQMNQYRAGNNGTDTGSGKYRKGQR